MRNRTKGKTRTLTITYKTFEEEPSKVNTPTPVPTTPPTLTIPALSPPLDAAATHPTVVPLIQADVAQKASPSEPVGVKSVDPNASPPSVAVSPPLCGMLELPVRAQLATGAAPYERVGARTTRYPRSDDQATSSTSKEQASTSVACGHARPAMADGQGAARAAKAHSHRQT